MEAPAGEETEVDVQPVRSVRARTTWKVVKMRRRR